MRRVGLGLVAAEPEELRRGEPRERPVAGQGDQPLEPDALLDLGALGGRALVVPEDRGADHLARRRRGTRARASARRARSRRRRGLPRPPRGRAGTHATSRPDPAPTSRDGASRADTRAPRARPPRPSGRRRAPSRPSCRCRVRSRPSRVGPPAVETARRGVPDDVGGEPDPGRPRAAPVQVAGARLGPVDRGKRRRARAGLAVDVTHRARRRRARRRGRRPCGTGPRGAPRRRSSRRSRR